VADHAQPIRAAVLAVEFAGRADSGALVYLVISKKQSEKSQ
jgi:hypothetical protein